MQKVAAENNKISNVFNGYLLTELSTHGLSANTRNVSRIMNLIAFGLVENAATQPSFASMNVCHKPCYFSHFFFRTADRDPLALARINIEKGE